MGMARELAGVLERGGVVVAANARAARDLRRLFAEGCVARGLKAWASPAIFDWHGWLQAEWQRLLLTGTEPRLLLSSVQEQWLWQGRVREFVEGRSLVSPGEVAGLAQRAYARLADYGGLGMLGRPWDIHSDLRAEAADLPEIQEPELFRGWAGDFESRCRRSGWLSGSRLVGVVAGALRERRVAAPVEMAWVGFDRVTPAMRELREALAAVGCLQVGGATESQARERCVVARTLDEEMEACAEWVRGYLETHAGARVGVLVQDVAGVRAQLDRVFRRVLMPGSAGLQAVETAPVYEFTLGMPLGDVPMVRAALLLLRWMTGPLEQDEISWLLLTGFLGGEEETPRLAAANARLRQRAKMVAPEEEMGAWLNRLAGVATLRWGSRVQKAAKQVGREREKKQSCGQWVRVVDGVLKTAGWPGARMQDAVGFQVRERWERVLEEVAALDFAEERIGFDAFVGQLTGHARSSIFSAESEGARVAISGVLESAGRVFDAVWVMGMTDEAWPARSSADPMLPRWLQKELGMPRGDAEEDRALSEAAMERLRGAAGELVFSYAREGMNGALRGSALLAGVGVGVEDVAASPSPGTMDLTEEYLDESVVVWPEGRVPRGGQSVLKRQAACPFQAFAATRLVSKFDEDSEHGLDAGKRGTLLHDVLAGVWGDPAMGGSAGLKERMVRGELEAVVREHVARALDELRADEGAWERAYLDLEGQRVSALAMEWLRMEAGRNPFVVEGVELPREIEIEGLRVMVRIDRVDAVGDGRVLMDYKTGMVTRNKWEGARPDEPQLPLYAVSGQVEGLRDVYFAQVRTGKQMRFVGAVTGDGNGLFKGQTREDAAAFEEMREEWAGVLGGLSREFQAGVARVDPKRGMKTCEYCGLGGLCRVAELGVRVDEDEEAG